MVDPERGEHPGEWKGQHMIIYNSSSTGTSDTYQFQTPVTKIALQGTGTWTGVVNGSVGGAFTQIVASSTAAASAIKYHSTGFMTSRVQVVLSAVGSTDFQLHVVGLP